jgi:hypothetical protein
MSTAPNTCIELERARKIEQEYARQLLEIGDSPVLRLGMADILMEQVLITEKKAWPLHVTRARRVARGNRNHPLCA